MVVDAQLIGSKRVLIVDDFVTKGATILAGASRVAEAFPDAEVRAFALVRTLGFVPNVESIIDLTVGQITYSEADGPRRNP